MLPINIPDLTDREAAILSAVVECYIESGIPVSSGFLTKNCGLNISSATIRNAMSSLEQKGYLNHLHTSGGRIPTDIGYRFYVNIIPEYQVLDNQITEKIEQELLIISNNVDELLNATAFMLAKVSHMFGVILVFGYQKSMLTDIELVALEGNRVMLVLAMDTGSVESIVLNLNLTIQPKLIQKITRILKERLVGFSLKEIQSTIRSRLNDTEMYSHGLVQILVKNSNEYVHIDNNKSTIPDSLLNEYSQLKEHLFYYNNVLDSLIENNIHNPGNNWNSDKFYIIEVLEVFEKENEAIGKLHRKYKPWAEIKVGHKLSIHK